MYVLDVETFCSIRLERPLCVALFAMQSLLCHHQVDFFLSFDSLLIVYSTISQQLITSRHRNGPVGLRRLPHLTDVHSWGNKRSMFLLSHCQSSLGRYMIYHLITLKRKLKMITQVSLRLDTSSSIAFMLVENKHQICIVSANQVAHVNCGNCRMLLMYQYGARSVKCAVCNFVTSVGVST